jgi:type IVB pilus formation R64 PilN family outer membrane protein
MGNRSITRALPLARCLVIAMFAFGLGGCAIAERTRQASDAFRKARSGIDEQHQAFGRAISDPAHRLAAQDVQRPWLAGRAQPLAREVILPPALRSDVDTALIFAQGPLDLNAVARRITLATNIPVHVRPDALLAPEAFLPRLSESIGQMLPEAGSTARIDLDDAPQPLARLLDRLCARLGIWWQYRQGRIEFYRTQTRVFNVRALALNASAEATMGQAAEEQQEGFVGSSRTRLESATHDAMLSLRSRLEPFLTRAGVMAVEPGASSSIVVTDTPDVLDRIAAYLDQENRAMTRRVRLVFEELAVQSHDDTQLGLDWSAVFSSAQLAAGYYLGASPVPGAAAARAGARGKSFGGSEAMIKAIGEAGKIIRRSSIPILTLNRRPVTHAVRTTFSYIDKVEAPPMGLAAGSAVSGTAVSQARQTVGSLLTLIPDAQEDGQILLSIAYDNTVAQPLKSVTFGDRASPLQLQQITVDGNGIIQQLALQPGQPVLISGFDHVRRESEGRRLNPGMPLVLGGSDKVSRQQVMTVIVVTAQVEEGY